MTDNTVNLAALGKEYAQEAVAQVGDKQALFDYGREHVEEVARDHIWEIASDNQYTIYPAHAKNVFDAAWSSDIDSAEAFLEDMSSNGKPYADSASIWECMTQLAFALIYNAAMDALEEALNEVYDSEQTASIQPESRPSDSDGIRCTMGNYYHYGSKSDMTDTRVAVLDWAKFGKELDSITICKDAEEAERCANKLRSMGMCDPRAEIEEVGIDSLSPEELACAEVFNDEGWW